MYLNGERPVFIGAPIRRAEIRKTIALGLLSVPYNFLICYNSHVGVILLSSKDSNTSGQYLISDPGKLDPLHKDLSLTLIHAILKRNDVIAVFDQSFFISILSIESNLNQNCYH